MLRNRLYKYIFLFHSHISSEVKNNESFNVIKPFWKNEDCPIYEFNTELYFNSVGLDKVNLLFLSHVLNVQTCF